MTGRAWKRPSPGATLPSPVRTLTQDCGLFVCLCFMYLNIYIYRYIYIAHAHACPRWFKIYTLGVFKFTFFKAHSCTFGALAGFGSFHTPGMSSSAHNTIGFSPAQRSSALLESTFSCYLAMLRLCFFVAHTFSCNLSRSVSYLKALLTMSPMPWIFESLFFHSYLLTIFCCGSFSQGVANVAGRAMSTPKSVCFCVLYTSIWIYFFRLVLTIEVKYL